MISKLILFSLAATSAFFNPSVRLSNGKTATLNGNGPPVLFSTGLFGTMPSQFYNEVINKLRKNITVVTIDGILPITPKDVVELTDALKVDRISYVSHSSFNSGILETGKLNSAVLLDPIVIPQFNINGFNTESVDVDYPVLVIKSEKLYQSKLDLPSWQELEINGNVNNEIYDDVGHPDILDDMWANVAKSTQLWGTAQGDIMPFNQWKFDNTNTIPKIRREYREYVSKKILQHVNNCLNEMSSEIIPI